MSNIYKTRLLKLAEVLENLPQEKKYLTTQIDKFDLSEWIYTSPCGTSGCAIGTAMFHPWFNEQGLRAEQYYPFFEDYHAWAAIRKFFNLNSDTADYLFEITKYDGDFPILPFHVATRIRLTVDKLYPVEEDTINKELILV